MKVAHILPRRSRTAALLFAGILAQTTLAAPTAVDDNFSTAEDSVLTVSGSGATVFTTTFDAGTTESFAYADDTFNTTAPNNESGSLQAAGGFNSTGGLFISIGNRPGVNPAGSGLRQSSGGWRRTFTAAGTTTYRFTGRYRIRTVGGMEANENGDFILDVDGARYGSNGTAPGLYVERLAGPNLTNQANTLTSDTGWKSFSQDIALTSGSHTLTLGIYNNNSTAAGENAELYLDEIAVSDPNGASGVLSNDTGGIDPVTAEKLTDPAHGSVVFNSNGTFTYTPVTNYSGSDSFTYRAVDGTGASAAATITITISALNDTPVANGDSYSTNEDTVLNVSAPGLMANDTDADGNTLTATLRSAANKGTAVVNTNGSFSYTPNLNATGADSFTYRVNDGTANSADATVNITINPVNDAPSGVADSYFTTVNTPLNVTLTDLAGQPTTTVVLVAPGSPIPIGDPAEVDLPEWRFLDDGTDPGATWRNPGFADSLWLTGKAELGYGDSSDGQPERTVVSFGPNSSTKYATTYFRTTFNVIDKASLSSLSMLLKRDDAAIVYLNGTEIYRDQSANGFPDLPSNPAYNQFSNGSISNADELALRDLTALMTVNAAQYLVEGTNTLAVEVHQANGTSSDLSMDIQLTAQRGPYAGVLYNDSDADGQALTAQIVTAPAGGGTFSLNANGTFSYTPPSGFVGVKTFIYRAFDGTAQSTDTTVTINVASAGNIAPAAGDDAYSTNEDTPLTVNAPGVLNNDTDPESGALTAQIITNATHGNVVLNTDGSFTYTPVANYNGPDSFTYRARDPLLASSPAATVMLTVTAVNDAPVASPESYGVDVGIPLTVPAATGVLANDSDAEGTTLTAALVTAPASGSLTLNPNGSFTYTPPAGFAGTRTFTYRASDGALVSNIVTVTFNIQGAPVANANNYSTTEDTPLTVNAPGVLGNDTDPQSLPLTAVNASQPAHGSVTLNANGSFTYTPAANYTGPDAFTYQASNGTRISAAASVSISVTPVNDSPLAQDDTFIGLPDQVLTVAAPGILGNDSDAEGSALILTKLSDPASGTLALSADGSFTYTPGTGFSGTDSFTYRVSDGSLNSTVATVTLRIEQPGDDIVINEILYRPGGGYPEDTSLEWIELYNRGTGTIDLTGWTISSGVSYTFPTGRTMSPGSYLVIAANVAAFQAANPGVTNVIGGWTGALANGGENIQLTDALLSDHDKVGYANEGDWATRGRVPVAVPPDPASGGWAWTSLAEGGGRSLELRNPTISNDNGQNWSVSSTTGGTPGAANDSHSTNIPPVIKAVKHSPPVPTTTDRVRISCELNDESAFSALTATLFWRDATTTNPGAFQSLPMSQDGKGEWFAKIEPRVNLSIVEFYISASDGVNTRTWPAPTSEGQNANCQYQVSNEGSSATAETYRLTLTAAENAAFVSVNQNSDRQFNHTLIITRGQESEIRYRCDMRIRGNSSRSYQFKPLRINLPSDDDLDGSTRFNLNPKASHLQHIGMKLMQSAGLRAPDTIPVELRRQGVESTTSSGNTPDYGQWVRMEDLSGEMVKNQWPLADTGGIYKKGRNDFYWRATQPAPGTPDGSLDGFLKQNSSAANDWSDCTNFFSVWQAACAPYFPGSPGNDAANSGGGSTSGIGNWNSGTFTAGQITSLETVADFDQWARWFAVMTILQSNETNASNGQDDDYGVYFEPRMVGVTQQRRLQFLPHDLDTIFGLGDSQLLFNSRGLYDSTDDGSVFRSLLPLFGNNSTAGNAAFRTKYHNAIRELCGTVFDTDSGAFQQAVDYHLGNWAPAANRTVIKDFVTARRTYLLSLIGAGPTTPAAGTSNATVTSAHGTLFISEVFAHNVSAHNNSGTFPDVIELQNTGAGAVSLTGMSLTDDPLVKAKYVFPAGASIAAGARLVIYADTAVTPGTHTGFGLDNDGGVVQLYNTVASGQAVIDAITYGLQPADFSIGRTGGALDTWALCTPTIGTANTAVASLTPPSGLKINEWLGNADYRAANDFIELYNPGAQPVALGGMSLTDDFVNFPTRHVIPQLSFMAAGGFTAFEAKGTASPLNARELAFGIDSSFGSVALLGANGSMVDRGDTLPQFRDIAMGRLPDGTGAFTTLSPPTPGYTNTSLAEGALDVLNHLRITEMMYNTANSTQSEYIELYNNSNTAAIPVTLDLSGVSFTNGISFTFPPGTTLAPGAFLVLVENAARFSAQFPSVTVGGLFVAPSKLDNGGERVRLAIPGANIAILDFNYNDKWYRSTDGGGDSLQIVSATASPAMWDRSEGWQASPPNPGSVPPYSVYAGADTAGTAGVPVYLDGVLNPGTFIPAAVAIAWTQVSGPGTVTFTTAACENANATFPSTGIYVLRLTATAAGPTTVTDTVTVTIFESYDAWTARELASQSAGNRLPTADPDNDGVTNLAEYALGSGPLNSGSTGMPVPAPFGGVLSFTWTRNLLADPAIQIIPQLSADLSLWQEGPAVMSTTATSTNGNLQNYVTSELPAGRTRVFARVLVIAP